MGIDEFPQLLGVKANETPPESNVWNTVLMNQRVERAPWEAKDFGRLLVGDEWLVRHGISFLLV